MCPKGPTPNVDSPGAEMTQHEPAQNIFSAEQIDAAAAAAAEKACGTWFDPAFYDRTQQAFWRGVALAALNTAVKAWLEDGRAPEKAPERDVEER